MILQALNNYYHRLAEDPVQEVAQPGFALAKISFALILDRQGGLVDVHDLREQKGKKLVPRQVLAPQAVKRSSGVAANFLWDNTGYVLGADNKGNPERALQTFKAFKELANELGEGLDDPGMAAVLAFLDAWRPEEAEALEQWEDMAGTNLVFRLDGERGFVHESPAIQRAWADNWGRDEDAVRGQCLVTGKLAALARLHPAIKGVWGAQSSGANLVSFNLDAFTSYGKEQSFNSPISAHAAFAYTTVLNRLLAPDSRQRIQIGDASVVFWSELKSPLEDFFGTVMGADAAGDDALNQRLAVFLKAAKEAQPFEHLNPRNPFYILGLSPMPPACRCASGWRAPRAR